MENQTKLSDHRLSCCLSSQNEGRTLSTQIRNKLWNPTPRTCWKDQSYRWIKSCSFQGRIFIKGCKKPDFRYDREAPANIPGDIKPSSLLH